MTEGQEVPEELKTTVSLSGEELLQDEMGPRRAYVIVIGGALIGKMFPIGEENPLIIGRSPDAGLRIDDDSVSRHHATIRQVPEGIRVEDSGSTNGVFVNGTRVREQLLYDGDRVQIGSATILKFSYQDELEQSFQQKLYESATRDELTGAYNKKYFLNQLEAEISFCRRHDSPFSLLLADIDHFKKVNDSYGHLAGDAVLKELAARVRGGIRQEDLFFRFGGEEFGLLLRLTPLEAALLVARRLHALVADEPFSWQDQGLSITISIGLTVFRRDDEAKELIHRADEALYRAKQNGRNRIESQT